jgi:hypothetical protein
MNTKVMSRTVLVIALLAVPIANRAFAAAVGVDPKGTVTATMDGGTAKTGNTWYELGVNTANPATGLKTGIVAGQTDPLSSYLFEPAVGNNALMLDNTTKSGTLTFLRPLSLTGLSIAGASGNGSPTPGTLIPTLHFSDNTTATLGALTVGDWFNQVPRVETAQGRIDVGANTFNNAGADNPRVLAIDTTLSAADSAKLITSIDLAWTGGTTTHTAIFGISGDFTGLGHFSAIPLDAGSFNQDIIVGLQEVPEPGTMVLLGLGAVGMLACVRRKRA